jgi:hypothetical protein
VNVDHDAPQHRAAGALADVVHAQAADLDVVGRERIARRP